jgi:tetratricopeptide (TPR) repeat protein
MSVAYLVFPTVLLMTACEAQENPNWCEAQFAALSKQFESAGRSDFGVVTAKWQEYAGRCSGTGVYEGRLAGLYVKQGRVAEARAVLNGISEQEVRDSPYVKAAHASVAFAELAHNSESTIAQYRGLEPLYRSVVSAAPDWAGSYELLAAYELFMGNAAEAVTNANRAIELSPDAWINYRTAAIAYSQLGKHLEAAKAGDRAQALHRGVSADVGFMLALARSYAALGDRETLKALLVLVTRYNPELQHSQQFQEELQSIRKALK